MKSINFNVGYKEYMINNDPNNLIRINVNDLNIPHRIEEVKDFFDKTAEKYKNDDRQMTADEMYEMDKLIREKINYALGTDVCTPAFGNVNCMSPLENGEEMLFMAFFNALMPVVEQDVKAVAQAQAIKLEDNTSKYINAAVNAPVAPAPVITASVAPELTQEQKAAMFDEMMRQKK